MNCKLQLMGAHAHPGRTRASAFARKLRRDKAATAGRGAVSWFVNPQVNGTAIAGKSLKRTEVRAPGMGYAVLRGKRIQIRGNTRTVRRQYAANELASVRVLPGIAGYCRVMSFRDFFGARNAAWGHAAYNPDAVRFGTPGNAWERLGTDKFFSRCKKMSLKSLFRGPKFQTGGRRWLPLSERRRIRSAAVQDAGARATRRVGDRRSTAARDVSTSAFARELPPSSRRRDYGATSRRDKQVVDISSRMAKCAL
jgi:hypothetical protein